MCGIVGAVGTSNAIDIVLAGLKKLEYRGYDSSGVGAFANGETHIRKSAGKLSELLKLLEKNPLPQPATTAIAHTRWATHGIPNSANAHPHQAGRITLVHNGIVENNQQLVAEASLTDLSSDTDSEIAAAWLNHQLQSEPDILKVLQDFQQQVLGSYAIGLIDAEQPDKLFAMRRSAPLTIGLAEGATYLASDPLALAGVTNRFIFLEDNDLAVLTAEGVTVYDAKGNIVPRSVKIIELEGAAAGKAGFPHFMLKEIHEQPAVLARLLEAYTNRQQTTFPDLEIDAKAISQITLAACGTAHYAGQIGQVYLEQIAAIPVRTEVASEFRYRQPPLPKNGVFIAISQSGETADTLAALEYAKSQDQLCICLTNTPTSSIARECDVVLNLHAEAEIAVASTKAFFAMVVSLLLLAIDLADKRNKKVDSQLWQDLMTLPAKVDQTIESLDLHPLAQWLQGFDHMLYLGRGVLAPLAYEGALKLKEITYIHAEAYPAGEMKHGPIALIDQDMPVINLAMSGDGLLDKTMSNVAEIKARQGRVIMLTDEAGAEHMSGIDTVVTVPTLHGYLQPLLLILPLQLLAYETAVVKGTDVDQPRNLAKSVTVE